MNNYSKEEFEMHIENALDECSTSPFQIETIKDVAWILSTDYNVDQTQILDNLSRLQSVSVVDKDYEADWSGVMTTEQDGRMSIKYKDFDSEVEKRAVLTHELVHCFASNAFEIQSDLGTDYKFETGLRVNGTNRYLNEVITEGIANEVMQKMGYELSEKQIGYPEIVDYGKAMLNTNLREEFIDSYFSKDKNILENEEIQRIGNCLYLGYNSVRSDDLNSLTCKPLLQNKFVISMSHLGCFDKENMSETEYSKTIQLLLKSEDSKKLTLSEEDINFLNYRRYSKRSEIQISDYLNENSNLNNSFKIIRSIQNNFPGEEIELKDIRFRQIDNDGVKDIIYSFNNKNYSLNSGEEYISNIKLNEKMFGWNNFFNSLKNDIDMAVNSNSDCKKIADIYKNVPLFEYSQKQLNSLNYNFSNFLINGEVKKDLICQHLWNDKNGNNILHIIGYANNHINNNEKFNIDLSEFTPKEIVALKRMMTEKNNEGLTPFEEAVKNNNVTAMKFYSDISREFGVKDFASGQLYFYDSIDALRYMLKGDNLTGSYGTVADFAKAIDINLDGKRFTPFEIIAQSGVTEGKILCEISSKDFNIVTERGNVLTYLTEQNELNTSFINHLLNREDVNVDVISKSYERSPLHNLLYNNEISDDKSQMISKIIELGADVNKKCISSDDVYEVNGKDVYTYISPLQIAYGMDKDLQPNIDYKMIELLVKNGADINADNEKYPSVLDKMHEKGDIEGLKALIDAGMSSKDVIGSFKENSNVSESDLQDLVKYEAENKPHLNVDTAEVKDKVSSADVEMDL